MNESNMKPPDIEAPEEVSAATEIIRFYIDAKWSAFAMSRFLLTIDDIYNLGRILHPYEDPIKDAKEITSLLFSPLSKDRLVFSISANLMSISNLEIRRLEYSSPGIADLAGFGEIVGHIKELILKIIEYLSSREDRELKRKQLSIQIIRDFLQTSEDFNLDKDELEKLLTWIYRRQIIIERHIEKGEITGVEILSPKKR